MSVDVPEQAGLVEDLPGEDVQPTARSRRPLVAGALGAAWALLVGLALMTFVVMLSWAVSPNPAGNSAAAWRAVGSAWLGAHLVPLEVSGEVITLLPVGGLLLGLLLSRRSGGWAGRMLPEPTGAEVRWCALGAALAYGAGGAGVAWLTSGGAASADPRWAGPITAAVAAVGTLWGMAREAGLIARWRARSSQSAWRTLMAGLAAVIGLFGAGAVLVTVGLVRHFQEVVGTLADLDPGPIGAAGLTLLGALSLPNLAVWAMSVLVGPGFELGRIGGLSAFGGEVESLPALPVLAAIPTSMPGWAPVLLLVPVAVGVLAGRVRWGRDLPTPAGTVVSGLGVAGVVAAGVAGLVALSSGSLGGDRLADVGPALVPVTASATGLVLLGFVLEAASQSLRLTWDLHRAERRAAAQARAGVDADLPEVPDAEPAGTDGSSAPAGPAEQASTEEPAPRGPAAVRMAAAGAGRVAGAGGAVRSRVAVAGASAVSVVTGAGGAVIELVASGAETVARVARTDGEAHAEIDLRDQPTDEAADQPTDEAADQSDEGGADEGGADEGGADEPVADGADEPVADGADDEADDTDDAVEIADPAHEVVEAVETADEVDTVGAADDDTDEIPIIRISREPGGPS